MDAVLAPLLSRVVSLLDWLAGMKLSSINVDDFFVNVFAGKNLTRRAKDVPAETVAAALDSLDVAEYKSTTRDKSSELYATYSFPVQPHMWNVTGLLHGGAIGMCVEQALRLHLATVGAESAWYIRSIEAKYLSSTKVCAQYEYYNFTWNNNNYVNDLTFFFWFLICRNKVLYSSTRRKSLCWPRRQDRRLRE